MPKLAEFGVLYESANDRLATCGLDRYHFRTLWPDPSEMLEFAERLPHTDHSHAAASGVKDGIRQIPAELLGRFQPHGLFALDAVRLFQSRDIKPVFASLAIGNSFGAVGDQTVHENNVGSKRFRFQEIRKRDILGHEHVCINARYGSIGRKRSSGVSCGGNGHFPDTELPAHRYGTRQASSF